MSEYRFHTVLVSSLMTAPLSAHADVVLWGTVDAGIEYTRAGSASAVRLESGLMTASRYGFRVREDLGDGLSAVVVMEAGFKLDTSEVTGGFARQSFVGLRGRFGQISVGRQYGTLYYTGSRETVFGYALAGNAQNFLRQAYARADNSIVYETPSMGGFLGRAFYGLGEERADLQRSGRAWGLGFEFVRGRFSTAGSYQHVIPVAAARANTVDGAIEDYAIGASYRFEDFRVNAGYYRRKPQGMPGYNSGWIGVSAPLGNGEGFASVATLNAPGRNTDATHFALGYVYRLSKRTALYASYGTMQNEERSQLGVRGSDNVAMVPLEAGVAAHTVMAGIRHQF